ncbi:uncharacterized protein [Rutidosis leptorrhynchoides]|uniref:uncharacterized protein n=1 Tax=Rutidosis leptorrhynchoides TaxID=125765 RepID=UPI003A98EC72
MSSVSDFSTDQGFNNREQLTEWVKSEAPSHNQVIVIRRTKEQNGYLVKIVFVCERGGVSKSKSTPKKSKPSKKINCKFEMVAKFSKKTGVWSIKMKQSVHNHEPIMYMEGHAYAVRLTNDEWRLVADLSSKNVRTGEILATLKKQNPENVSSSKTVYNAKAKLRTIFRANRTPIQVVMSFLKEKGYDFQYHVTKYLHEVWLNKYAHMFVSVVTDKSLNFGNSTTNRVESQHAKNLWAKYEHPSFELLWNCVSLTAIEKIHAELGRFNKRKITNENCGCKLRSCFGLPCAHEQAIYLNAGMFIPLESIDIFWKTLSFSPCISAQDGNFHCDPKSDMLSHIQEPVVHINTRGRPSVKEQKKGVNEPTTGTCQT